MTLGEACGEVLRHERHRRGLTLQEASRIVPCSISYLSDMERGRHNPGLVTLQAFAVIYGVKLSDLIFCAEEIVEEADGRTG